MKIKNNENRQSLDEAKTIVIRYLKYRPRSEYEIVEKLRDKKFSEDVIRDTVTYLKKISAVNDEQFAIAWTRSRLNKPFGVQRIRMELRQKGVSDEHIINAVDAAMQDYAEPEVIQQLAAQRLRQYRYLDQQTARRRLYGYLLRRGFSSEAIVKAIKQLFDQ